MAIFKRIVIFAGLACALFVGSPWSAPAARAGTPFDGNWSVLVVTDSGSCDRAYRYALHINDGRITYDDPSIAISGRVTPRGAVRVTVSAGGQSASGSGHLSAGSGGGRWSGHSSTSACSGYWQAERRG